MFFLESEYLETLTESVEPTDMGLEGLEGALIAVSECDEQYFNLREKMMKLEHLAIVNEDMELLQEGKASFGENVKNILAKLKRMIEELYRKFIDWITKTFGSDKKFVERFGEGEHFASSTQLQGYSFAGVAGFDGKLAAAGKRAFVGVTTNGIEMVARDLGVTAESKSELTKAVKEYLYGGKEKSNQTLKAAQCLDILKTAKKDMDDAKKAKETVQRSLDNLIKAMKGSDLKGTFQTDGVDNDGIQQFKSTSSKASDDVKEKHNGKDGSGAKFITSRKEAATAMATAYGAYIDALKERRNQARVALGMMMKTKAKADREAKRAEKEASKNESFFGILGEF